MITHTLNDNDSVVGSECSSNRYNTRSSLRKSMTQINQQDRGSKSSITCETDRKTSSLVSIFRRESTGSVGKVEGEPNTNSRNYSGIIRSIRRLSSSSVREDSEGRNSRGSSTRDRGRGSNYRPPERNTRRSSLFLERIDCDDNGSNHQLVPHENNFTMDSSCCIVPGSERKQKCTGVLPCLIALGAIIIIAIPLAKILGCLRREIYEIHNEMSGIKKQVGYVGTDDSKNPVSKISKECSAAIKYLVKEELGSFDADKTGRTDFALESAGGRIIKTIDTVNYGSTVGFLGFTLCEGPNGPRAMIQANSGLGECWAFKGSKGKVLIKLLGKVAIDGVSLEHIPSKLAPTGKLDTAPRHFSIYGVADSKKDKVLLGRFEYKIDSDPVQTFAISSSCREPFEFVEFHVESNHGSSEYTCVYRLRIHGTLMSL